jgi:hypothetical protein
MNLDNSILIDIRESVGLAPTNSDFDKEIIPHINAAIGKLNQNGIGMYLVVTGDEQKWSDLKDPNQVEGNKYFSSIPLFIMVSTKILFDPPPPSSVSYHATNVSESLWRLKIAYEYYEPIVPIVEGDVFE